MSKETPRIQAIRKNVVHLDEHIQEFITSCENICDALDTLEDTVLLKKVFLQIIVSLQDVSSHTQRQHASIEGELDEFVTITKIDNQINIHLRHIEELIVNIQKVFSTSKLGQAVGFALIGQEIARLRRARKKSSEIYLTIRAHYTDQEGTITAFLEETSGQSATGKMLHNALQDKYRI